MTEEIKLHTERLIVRSPRVEDAQDVFTLMKDKNTAMITGFTPMSNISEAEGKIRRGISGGNMFVITTEEKPGHAIGVFEVTSLKVSNIHGENPMLVKSTHTLAHINGVTNAVLLEGEPVGQIILSGPGAGEFPTASSVVGDIVAICSELHKTDSMLPMMRCTHSENAVPVLISETTNKYYMLLSVSNTPGVIGTIGTICGKHNINLASLLQKESEEGNGKTAEVVVVTAKCLEADVQSAIQELSSSGCINEVINLIRVMD